MHDDSNAKKETVRIMMLGDVVGATGRALCARHIATIKEEHQIDCVIANGENAADDGKGIMPNDAQFLLSHGVDVITSGNHIWDKKEIIPFIEKNSMLIRPANYSFDAPGSGYTIKESAGILYGVINLMGRVFMPSSTDCPFLKAQELIFLLKEKTNIILIDMHAQATAEKMGLAYFLDGMVTAIVGTHTHTQTMDERILPSGTAYISDAGMIGSQHSILGYKVQSFKDQGMRVAKKVETMQPYCINGVIITADVATGKALAIERYAVIDTQQV